MAQLQPIHTITFAQAGDSSDISTLISPPYDVLDESPKRALLASNPHNIVAVDLPVTPPKTLGPDEAYAAAAKTFQALMSEGVLQHDPNTLLFAYEQRFEVDGQHHARLGLFCVLRAEEFNQPRGIFRHEKTIQGGTDDRMKLLQATEAQLSPVFAVFDDPEKSITQLLREVTGSRQPDFVGSTPNDGVVHRCWRIAEQRMFRAIEQSLASKEVFIADGHHRYTTALNYAKAHPERPEASGCLCVLVPMQDPGLLVLATHRVITSLSNWSIDALRDVIAPHTEFLLSERHDAPSSQALTQIASALRDQGHHAMALYDASSKGCYILSCRSADPLLTVMPHRAELWRKLDVAVLHELFIDRVMRPRFGGEAIRYTYPHAVSALKEQCDAQNCNLGVIVQPTSLRQVCDIAKAGEVMPPKSTFFYPKLATGLVIHSVAAHRAS